MMSRIIAATFLLLFLVDSTASASGQFKDLEEFISAGFTKRHILKCICIPMPNGRLKCPHPLSKYDIVKEDLKKCLCLKTTNNCHPSIKKLCGTNCVIGASPL